MRSTKGGTLKGDLLGGLAAATISLPMSIGYGITAFSSLGGDFLPIAAVIGINAVVLSCLFSAIFNGTPTLISGPSGPITIVLVTVIAELQVVLAPFSNSHNQSALILGSAALCLVMGGLYQTLLGYFRIGTLTKYVPYPVMSGFINGIAISLIWRQLPNLLGTDNGVPVLDVIQSWHLDHPAALLVGATTIGSVLIAKRYLPRLSPPLLGLLAGVALYYAMGATFNSVHAGPIIGEVRLAQVNATFTAVVSGIQDLKLIGTILPDVLFFGLLICLVSSIETLMSSAAIGYRAGERYDSNRDLLGQGIGNIAAGLISPLPSSGSLVRSVANMSTGGKTRWSGIICSALILLVFLAAQQYLGKIPLAVLSGLIIAISLSLFDGSEFVLLFRTLREDKFTREIGLNFLISLTVTVLTVAVDLALAIIVGILITTANFVVKTGKSVVRRTYRCDQIQSKRVRNMEHTRYLKNNGSHILVVELQGPLFFGSAEEVAKEVEATNHGTTYTILNMKRISEIDITGAKSLLQMHASLKKRHKTLLISHIWEGNPLWDALNYADAIDIIGRGRFFSDIDSALEYAEDQILCGGLCDVSTRTFALSEMDILAGFSEEEIKNIDTCLQFESYNSGDVIIREGDQERDLFLLLRGMVSTRLQLLKGRQRRLNTITAGVAFGEIAMLDRKPRSADIVAEDTVDLYRLTYSHFVDLQKNEPRLANKLILNMALILSTRLRMSTDEIKLMLES